MKPETTLKELLKPPFVCRGQIIIDTDNRPICTLNDNTTIDHDCFIVEALNREWARRYGEPLRWKYFYSESDGEDFRDHECEFTHLFQCSGCSFTVEYPDDHGIKPSIAGYNYCPSCGVRLLPPGEDNGK